MQVDQFQGDNCLKFLPPSLVVPKRFTAKYCRAGRVDFSIPDSLFETNGLSQHQHELIVTGNDGDHLLVPKVDLSLFESPASKQLANGLIRVQVSGIMGHDPVLKRDVVSNLYLDKASGGVCRSSNMSMEPRTFMVACQQSTPNAKVSAFGPEGEAATILRNLHRIAAEIDPSI